MSHPRRVFVDFPAGHTAHGLELALSENDSHHLRSVLRLEEGSLLTAVNRTSAEEYEAIICAVEKTVTIRILSKKETRSPISRVKSLIFALAKGKKNDFVCEKACELGVRNIILWQSDRSVVRIDSESDRVKKLQRWNTIVESAAKQSGNDLIPQVSLALDVAELSVQIKKLKTLEDRAFICSLGPDSKQALQLPTPMGSVHLAVGPEGDFTDKEESALCELGFERLSLGPLVLRCETAAVVAISMIHGAWGFIDP